MRDCPTAMNDLNGDLLLIRNCCFNNFLLLNPDKTKLMAFGSRQLLAKLPDFKISLLGKDPAVASSAKNLGVVLDLQLTTDDHVLNTTSSCMSSLAQISRVKRVLDRNQLVTVINALVFSKLLYCSTVWSNTANKTKQCRTMQNSAEQCKTVQNNAKQCRTMQNSAEQCKTVQNKTKQCRTMQNSAEQCKTVQNFAARVVTGIRKFDHITPCTTRSTLVSS